MERLSKLHRRWLFLMIGSIVLIAGALIGDALATSQIEELEAAKAKWVTRPFTRYHVVIEQNGFGSCRQDFEMEDEVVTTVFANSCGSAAPDTITDMFNDIESIITSQKCTPSGCECQGVITVQVVYHEQLGYPVSTHPYARKDRFRDWAKMLRPFAQVGCTMIGWSAPDIIVAVTPLP